MAIVLTNNAESVLTSSITSGATTISITAGDASKFPALTNPGDYAIGVLEDITTTPTTREIVQVTARAANSLTIVRAQEGTAASAFPLNATFSLRLTAGAVAQYLGSVPLVIPNLFITTAMLKDGAAAGTKLYAPDIVTIVQATTGIIGSSNLASGLTLAGATSLTGALGVTGASTFTSGTFSTTLGVTGNTTIGGTLGVTGASTLTGALTASGGISGIGGLAFSLTNNAGNSLISFAANNSLQCIPGTSLALYTTSAATITGGTVAINGPTTVTGALTATGNLVCNGFVQATGSTAQSGTSYYLSAAAGYTTGAWSVGMGFYCGAQWMGAGGFATLSDRRAKEDIEDITAADAHAWLSKGRARRFTVNGKPSAGFIAQEDIEAGRGQAVTLIADEDPRFAAETPHAPAGHRLNRDYNHDVAYLTAALQDCLARIAVLESRVP